MFTIFADVEIAAGVRYSFVVDDDNQVVAKAPTIREAFEAAIQQGQVMVWLELEGKTWSVRLNCEPVSEDIPA